MNTSLEQASAPDGLIVEGYNNLPALELTAGADGTVRYRYIVEKDDYPGFDGQWRVMREAEKREHLRLGGKIAAWLQGLT